MPCALDVQLDGNELTVALCCRYTKGARSNMAVLEVNALSGYEIDTEKLDTLIEVEQVQRVEIDKGDTKANIYFKEVRSSVLTCE